MLETRPSSEFSYYGGKSKLANLRTGPDAEAQAVLKTPGDIDTYDECADSIGCTGHQGNLLKLSAKIDLESQLTIGCAGAVLAHLQRKRAAQYLPGDEAAHSAFQVSAIAMFNLDGFM